MARNVPLGYHADVFRDTQAVRITRLPLTTVVYRALHPLTQLALCFHVATVFVPLLVRFQDAH